jgi:hypothetical protein
LHDPGTIRARCAAIVRSVEAGVSPSFTIDRSRLPAVAERVAALTLRRFPDLVIPFHSRWRHFEAGGVNRKAELDTALAGLSVADRARAHFDLTVVSVLLDAGAGADWRYTESAATTAPATPRPVDDPDALLAALDRSASAAAHTPAPAAAAEPAPPRDRRSCLQHAPKAWAWPAFALSWRAVFQPTPASPAVRTQRPCATCRCGGPACTIFQSSPQQPDGRPGRPRQPCWRGWARRCKTEATRDGLQARPRSADLRPPHRRRQRAPRCPRSEVLGEVLRCLSPIWPSGSKVQGLAGRRCLVHTAGQAAAVGKTAPRQVDRTTDGWVPFHKLSQWMSYSLLEPLQWAGVTVTGLEALDGPAGVPQRRPAAGRRCDRAAQPAPAGPCAGHLATSSSSNGGRSPWCCSTNCPCWCANGWAASADTTAPGLHPGGRHLGCRPRDRGRTAPRWRTTACRIDSDGTVF